jgi:hypothetical protein
MMTRLRKHLSFANLIAAIALFVALGGTSFAVTQLPGAGGLKRVTSRASASRGATAHASKKKKKKKNQGTQGPGGSQGTNGGQGSTGPQGLTGSQGPAGSQGPPGPTGTTVVTQPAAWTLRLSSPQSNSVVADGPDPNQEHFTDTTASEFDGFYFGGLIGNSVANGWMQTTLLSPSELSGTHVRLDSVSFCYYVGPDFPGATATNTTIDHVTVIQVDENVSSNGSRFPQPEVTLPLDRDTSLANDTYGCPTFTLTNPPLVSSGSYLLLRIDVRDASSQDSTGAIAQLGRVKANYGP